ncbi:MAG TPA: L,D-transpeptidase family protein [Chitinophagaceae bacterium]|nr:L,D-transpeptidase family protein [Chitinophagaceae bacterium]
MRRLALAFAVFVIFFSAGAAPRRQSSDTLAAGQIIVVLSTGWDSSRATLYAFNNTGSNWRLQFSNPVFVGAKGMGVGNGIVALSIKDAPVKKEGDLKAPAGIFKIGDAFGYAPPARASWIKGRYIQATDTVFCVDDPTSIYYNNIISADTAAKHDWRSFEYMRRKDDDYKWGLFVAHNYPATEAGNGSCIFIHIGAGDDFATEGCTAMKENYMLSLLHWVDAAQHPLLVQMPATAYPAIAQQFGLPVIP